MLKGLEMLRKFTFNVVLSWIHKNQIKALIFLYGLKSEVSDGQNPLKYEIQIQELRQKWVICNHCTDGVISHCMVCLAWEELRAGQDLVMFFKGLLEERAKL